MWSKTKKKLEAFMCDSLKGRLEFHYANYRMHEGIGRAYITFDKKEIYNMCTLKRDYYQEPKEGLFSQVEFSKAVYEFLNNAIEESLKSENQLIKMLAVLDRRVGKRILESIMPNIESEHEIVQYLYKLRCEVEGIKIL